VAALGGVSVNKTIMRRLTAERVERKEEGKEGKRKRKRERGGGGKRKRRSYLVWLRFCAKRTAAQASLFFKGPVYKHQYLKKNEWPARFSW
jgi:hypothetical protein